MFVVLCIIIIGICTLTALGVAAHSHITGCGKINDGWFAVVIVGMILMLGTIITLCNTINWK
jgi:hypothetical protein